MTREQLFLSELERIKRITAWVAFRHHLRTADSEDFGSYVMERLVENDYAILTKFQGRCALKTYLTTVINRLYLDFQVKRFGKWRTSAEARRLGPLALRLETLLYRDGLTFDEACGVLQTNFRAEESREDLHALMLRIPRRARRTAPRGEEPDGWTDPPAPSGDASSEMERKERQALADRTFGAARRAMARLSPRDRILLRLNHEESRTLAEVARLLREDQKLLYRRREGIYAQLRRELEAEGVTAEDVRTLLARLDWDAALTPGDEEADARDREGGHR
jgi:RNA polymerase sigma factor for flagellar operon FliA